LVDPRVCRHFACHPALPGVIAAVTFSPYQLLISQDGGSTWEDWTGDFPGQHMVDLLFAEDGGTLYVASVYEGVFAAAFPGVPVPLNLEVQVSGSLVQLTWNGDPLYLSYNVYRSEAPWGPFEQVAGVTLPTYSEPVDGEAAFYRVTGEY